MGKNDEGQGGRWEETWDARLAGLEAVLGRPDDNVFHALIPFFMGGPSDVVAFRQHVPGITYVTAELTGEDSGQVASSLGNYELMISAKRELPDAAGLVANLARYTLEARLEPGETMDLPPEGWFGDSTIRALLFANPGDGPMHFEFLGHRYGLLLCIGITEKELAFKHSHDGEELLALLTRHRVFPYTTPDRPSVPLP